MDEIYRVMADANRRRIVGLLIEGPQSAGRLAEAVALAPNAMSFHLRALRSAGLVEVRRQGRHLWYALRADRLEPWRREVETAFATDGVGSAATGPIPVSEERETATDEGSWSESLPTTLL